MQKESGMEIVSSASKGTEYPITEIEARKAVQLLLSYIGEDPAREGLVDTPARVIRSYEELYGGYSVRAEDVLKATFTECGEYDEMVLLRSVDFFSTCEHHMLPFFGKVSVGYIPGKKVVGISKLARLVEVHARRLQIQERMTADIAADLERVLHPQGVAVIVEAQHFCMTSRGVEKANAKMVTSKLTGVFREDPTARAEFLKLAGV